MLCIESVCSQRSDFSSFCMNRSSFTTVTGTSRHNQADARVAHWRDQYTHKPLPTRPSSLQYLNTSVNLEPSKSGLAIVEADSGENLFAEYRTMATSRSTPSGHPLQHLTPAVVRSAPGPARTGAKASKRFQASSSMPQVPTRHQRFLRKDL